MSKITIILLALGLAMDAFAVSVSSGIAIKQMRVRHAMLVASFFGIFQALMPVVGWALGRSARSLVSQWDHWVVFALLAFVGVKMIYEAYKFKENESSFDPLDIYVLFTLAIATSIDAFAVGISLSLLHTSILFPVLIIGAVTFVMSFAGAYLGQLFGHLSEKKLLAAGGLALIAIGIKVLIEHLYLS